MNFINKLGRAVAALTVAVAVLPAVAFGVGVGAVVLLGGMGEQIDRWSQKPEQRQPFNETTMGKLVTSVKELSSACGEYISTGNKEPLAKLAEKFDPDFKADTSNDKDDSATMTI